MDCIEKYCELEQLEESNMWYCNKCKVHVRAWKQVSLFRTPPILIVHLKRFHFSSTTHRRDKIDTLIHFPLTGLKFASLLKEMWQEEVEVGEEEVVNGNAIAEDDGGNSNYQSDGAVEEGGGGGWVEHPRRRSGMGGDCRLP